MGEVPADVWWHPALAVFYGGSLAALFACTALLFLRKMHLAEGMVAFMLSVALAGGLSLLAFSVRDCGAPTGTETAGQFIASCDRWDRHPLAAVFGLPILAWSAAGLAALANRVRMARRGEAPPIGYRTPARVVIGALSALLLTSLGGLQIVAAPLTVPALWWAVRGAHPAARYLLCLIAALTMFVVGLAISWPLHDEGWPVLLLAPSVIAGATVGVFLATTSPAPRPRRGARR